TVIVSDYIVALDAMKYMCVHSPQSIIELDHKGRLFSRFKNGEIYHRALGGMSGNDAPSNQSERTCAAAERTGRALLHTLYQGNLAHKTVFYKECIAVDLVKADDGRIDGGIDLCIATGETVFVKAKITILATGVAGSIHEYSTSA
ncbi:FAD-binding protein, partial [Francisella tularensis]|nr:FAD-binding protein [Francisella tularensis]